MEQISKPHIVDLLRVFDRRRMVLPRIRYASVRSKPELINDLKQYFFTYNRENLIHFKLRESARASLHHLPQIAYDLDKKRYLFDDSPFDVQTESRKRVHFSISHEPVTLFGPSTDQPST